MLKGVIFDMDGLMIDTEKLLTRFWCEAANHYGYPMTKEHVLGIRSLAAKYAIPHLKSIFGEDFDYYKVRAKRIELMNEFIRQNGIEKKKGLDELLDYLDSTGLKKAVATATDLQRTTLYLSSINIIDRFDKLICGNMIENGIRSAHTAGCKPVMIPDLSQPDEETKKLLYACCDDLSKVIGVIQKLV